LATQEAMGEQNQAIGEANKQVVTITTRAEQESGVAITKVNQELAVAKLQLKAAERLAEAQLARGTAEANVILLQLQAEADPLKKQVMAFGNDGNAYARYFFYQKVAPSIRSILTDTNGPFGEIFRQYMTPQPLSPRSAPSAAQAPQPKPAGSPAGGAATSSSEIESQNLTEVKR